MKNYSQQIHSSNFSPLYKGEREGVRRSVTTPPLPVRQAGSLPSYEGRKSAGFTLIELLIAIGIFSVVIVIITGVFGRFTEIERHSIAQGVLILDVQSAVESFIKEARTGYGSTYNPENGNQVSFRNQSRACVTYRFVPGSGSNPGMLERAEAGSNTTGACNSGSFTPGSYTALTSKNTNITSIFFDATISTAGTSGPLSLANQGVITLSLTAAPKKPGLLPISIQNTVTSRQTKAYE